MANNQPTPTQATTEAAVAQQPEVQPAPEAATARAAYDVEQDKTPVPKKVLKRKNWFARHKVLTVILAVLLALGVFIFYSYNKAKAAMASTTYQFVRTTTLKKTSLDNSVTTKGTVSAGNTASVTVSDSAKLYKVTEVLVKVGDEVKTGDVIANLDTTDVLKNIEKAKQDYSDTLTAAQTSYNRAVDDLNTATVEHQNKLIDLQKSIDEANTTLTKSQEEQTTAQKTYDSASATYNTVKAAYDTAKAEIATFQAAYDAAATKQTSSLNDLNAAISNYQSRAGEYQAGLVDEATLVTCAQDLANAYSLYNGNSSQATTAAAAAASAAANVVNIPALQDQLISYGVSEAAARTVHDGGIAYVDSAVGICEAAEKNLTDAQGSLSNTSLGYSGMAAFEKGLTEAQTTLTTATTNLDKAKSTVEANQKAVETAQKNYDTEKNSTTLKQKSQSVEDAKTKLTQAKRTPDNLTTLETTLQNCTLTATMPGTVTALNATVGSVCSGTVATIQDIDGLTVKITIAADKVANVKTGMPCYITADTTSDTINGTLTQIDPVANDAGTFGAEVSVAGTDSGLLIGTSAQVEIVQSQTENVFVVPIDAIGTAEDGSSFVYRKTGGEGTDMTFEQVTVTTGASNDYYTEISGDTLAEGDVVRSSSDLSEGIESSANTEDSMAMMMGDNVSVTAADEGGRGGPDGGTPPSGGNGGAPGGM